MNSGFNPWSVADLPVGGRAFISKGDVGEGELGDYFVWATTPLHDGGGDGCCEVTRVSGSLLHVRLNLLMEFHLPIR